MPLSWNEIRNNALAFSREWTGEKREEAEAKSFWDAFFTVFGVKRRLVASFEEPVKKLSGTWGYIDLFWKGKLLVEHKSLGKPLDKAHSQAMEYIQGLKNEGRDKEIPRYIVVSDFARIALHDLEAPASSSEFAMLGDDDPPSIEFALEDFHKNVNYFAFIPGYKQHKLADQDPINIEAVERLGDLHDALADGGYSGHELERFLVRILFCLFAEDTGLFDRDAFSLYIENHTAEDGSDLGAQLARLFQILNTHEDRRQKNLLEELSQLPYVNGALFAEALGFADFNKAMRDALLTCCGFDWSKISPAVFGSLFQSVMEPKERRKVGAHYTSERDILKLVNSLFLDDLKAEFEKVKNSKTKLDALHRKLSTLKFLDPACGCGNFLVVTYRELRLLELGILKEKYKGSTQGMLGVQQLSLLDVDAMYGIEINEFPAQIAQVAMWLIDHQMNLKLGVEFGIPSQRLPLTKSATIRHGNALRIDWNDVLPSGECSYVMGNPPFIGGKYQNDEQRSDMEHVSGKVKNSGLLDYVTAWYFKAADYTRTEPNRTEPNRTEPNRTEPNRTEPDSIRCAFVSTNSISQGEQVGVLWGELFRRGIKIHFAHRTFAWKSEARGAAHVHVIIVGFGYGDTSSKLIYDYDEDENKPNVSKAKNISPYLVEGNDSVIMNRSKPLCDVPEMVSGNQPLDNGNYFFTPEQKAVFLKEEPGAEPYFRRWLGGEEFINSIERWCLWLGDTSPSILRSLPRCIERIEAVRNFRTSCNRKQTKALASTPTRFGVEVLAKHPYLAIPQVSSERRNIIPIAYLSPEILVGEKLRVVKDASIFHIGILISSMHMSWVKRVTGRLKSDYQYSVKLVYNNFPWPVYATDAQKAVVEAKAQAVLDARALFPDASLADLYDPNTMPPALTKAHAELDRAVEKCYRKEPFHSDRERVEFLFQLYEKLATPLTATTKPKRRRNSNES